VRRRLLHNALLACLLDVLQEPFRALYHPTIMAEHPIFKWRHFAPEIILCRPLVPAMLALLSRGPRASRGARLEGGSHHRLAMGSVYAPELEQRTRLHLKPTNKSWRVDETYVRIRCPWFYLYRALDSS
jgi:hypothetical protein